VSLQNLAYQLKLSPLTPNVQTTNYTLAIDDAVKVVEVDSTVARTVTIPTNATVAFPIGVSIPLFQANTGTVTVAAASGVTLRSRGNLVNLAGQYAEASLRQRAANEWVLVGDLA
jgi:hypothetical protein